MAGPSSCCLELVQVTRPQRSFFFCSRELSPLEEASLQNQKLRATYEARLARLNPNQAVQKTSLASGAVWEDNGPLGSHGSQAVWSTHFWGEGETSGALFAQKLR